MQHLFTNGLLFIYVIIAGNVLLLRNNLNLSPDIAEVSQEKLLSLVAERLIDSNSNVNVRVAFVITGDINSFMILVDLTIFLIVL